MGIQFPRRWDVGTISTKSDVIWGMSAKPVSARCLILAAISVLNGCAFSEPFTAPEIVAGSEMSVTLRTGSLRNADAYAQRYCAEYGRRAVLTARGEMGQKAITYHLYDCVHGGSRGGDE